MKKGIVLGALLLFGLVSGVGALKLTQDIVARHLHMASGIDKQTDANVYCLTCHGKRGQSEVPFSGGRIGHMGGGDDCLQCHDGSHPQAPDFSPILEGTGTNSCADCHITATKGKK